MLETVRLGEHRRMREIIREIQADALRSKEAPPESDEFFFLEELPPFYAAMSRKPCQPGETLSATVPAEFADDSADLESFRHLRELPQVRFAELRRNVAALLEEHERVWLDDVLTEFPPKEGVLEVLGYVAVAMEEHQHVISEDQTLPIQTGASAEWQVPMVLFSRTNHE